MQFSDDTASIPDSLVASQERGEVVFLCGAGLSQRHGLPSFRKLTEEVYATLGLSWIGHPAEEDAMGLDADGRETGTVSLDRALFALSKRLRGSDAASKIRAERLLIDAVESSLRAGPGPYVAHADVWTLSRDSEMRSRVVTTNFDTLFERTAPPGTLSRAGPDLPPPLGTDFTGILHLHGRIADPDLALTRTALVMNSAEFGEAYLRAGWAARYVYDLARATTIVILGYGADDPPMRYILEVLTADRERYTDIRDIFAFVPCAPDPTVRARTQAIWQAKGATPILYDSQSPSDHDTLYRTIALWADFSKDPTNWRRVEADRILRQAPETLSDADWSRLKWLLGAGDAGELLGDINPAPAWAEFLAKAGLFSNEKLPPLQWILKRLNDKDMPAAVAEHIPLSLSTVAGLERTLSWQNRKSKDIDPIFLQAWRLIVQVANERATIGADLGLRWFRTISALEEGDTSLAIKRDILTCLRPRVGIGHVFRWPGLELEEPEAPRLRDLLRIDWGPRGFDKIDRLVSHWPAESRQDLVKALTQEMIGALEEAADTQTLHISSSDIKSIASHRQDRHPDGFYSIVRAIIDLWEADLADHPEACRALALSWLSAPYLLNRRMGLHALSKPIFTGQEIADALLALADEEFWLGDARRETMQLFVTRWTDLDAADRQRVEQRIANGMPRVLLVPDAPEDQIEMVRDNAMFVRLARIEGVGHQLTGPGRAALDALQSKYPAWRSEGERDEFRIWSSDAHMVGNQGDITLLDGIAPDKLLAKVEEVEQGDPFRQGEVWRLYCDADPLTALQALVSTDPTGEEKAGAWQSFFWSISHSDDPQVHQNALAAVAAPGFRFKPVHPILDWLLGKRALLTAPSADILSLWDGLFDRLSKKAEPIDEQSRSDVLFSMLNSAEGKIGSLLLEEYDHIAKHPGQGAAADILTRIDRLVAAPAKLGLLGTAAVMEGLARLYQDAPDWTAKTLLPRTRWFSPAAGAAWSVLLRGHIPQPNLFEALKPALLVAGSHAELDRSLENLAGWLLAPLLWAQVPDADPPSFTAVEARLALSTSVESVRSSAAHWLAGAIEELPGPGGVVWRERVGPLFSQVWPLEPRCRSEGATLHLIRLLVRTGDAFADAVEAVAPALGPAESWDIDMWLGRDEDAKPFYDSAPAAMLTLLDAVVTQHALPGKLPEMLAKLVAVDPALEADRRYLKLIGWARRRAAP